MGSFNNMRMIQIADLIDEKEPKCICGKTLEGGLLKNYPHDGGIQVAGYKRKQWVYVHCRCGYDMAVWKIKRELGL